MNPHLINTSSFVLIIISLFLSSFSSLAVELKEQANSEPIEVNIDSSISGDQVVDQFVTVIAELDKLINVTLKVELICKGLKCTRILGETRFGVKTFCSNDNETLEWKLKLKGNGQASLIVNLLNEDDIDEHIYKINNAHSSIEIKVGKSHLLTTWSTIIGYIYFFAWMLSLYPILFTNFNRKSVTGLNLDFVALNTTGYLSYSIYNVCLFCIDEFQEAYFVKFPASQIPVQFNDVLFATHGFVINILICIQCIIYERNGQTISRTAKNLLIAIYSPAIVLTFLFIVNGIDRYYYISFFSYCKLTLTLCKYIPQAYFNFKRQSTAGWSVVYCFLDFIGGSFSILQMILNSINQDDYRNFTGNIGKVGLGLISLIFDILFMIQHYILYRHKDDSILGNDQSNSDYGSSNLSSNNSDRFAINQVIEDGLIDKSQKNVKLNKAVDSKENGIKNQGYDEN